MEVYSARRVLAFSSDFMLSGSLSADLKTGWDFNKLGHRISFVLEVKARRPHVLVLSPPCTMFSCLTNLNWSKMQVDVREAKFKEGVLHLEFCCLLIELQLSEGGAQCSNTPQEGVELGKQAGPRVAQYARHAYVEFRYV